MGSGARGAGWGWAVKTTHTPGPWKATHIKGRTTNEHIRITGGDAGTDGEDCMYLEIPALGTRGQNGMGRRDWANARLIAASPDLLAALEAALPALEWHAFRYPNDKDEQRIYDAARAAIAKAKGETQ